MNQNPYVDATTLPERLSPDPPVKEQAFSGTPARQTWNHAFSDQAPAGYVDGPFLVVQSGTTLPNHCLVTNTPLPDQTAQRLTLNWCSPFYLVPVFDWLAIVSSGLPGISQAMPPLVLHQAPGSTTDFQTEPDQAAGHYGIPVSHNRRFRFWHADRWNDRIGIVVHLGHCLAGSFQPTGCIEVP